MTAYNEVQTTSFSEAQRLELVANAGWLTGELSSEFIGIRESVDGRLKTDAERHAVALDAIDDAVLAKYYGSVPKNKVPYAKRSAECLRDTIRAMFIYALENMPEAWLKQHEVFLSSIR